MNLKPALSAPRKFPTARVKLERVARSQAVCLAALCAQPLRARGSQTTTDSPP